MPDIRTATCHCGAVELEIEFPAAPESLRAIRCNCSLCRRKGAVMIGVSRENVRILAGANQLTCYQWNLRIAEHYFCRICGIYTHHRRRRDPGQIGINAGCINGLDVFALGDVEVVDGASLSVVESDSTGSRS